MIKETEADGNPIKTENTQKTSLSPAQNVSHQNKVKTNQVQDHKKLVIKTKKQLIVQIVSIGCCIVW